ncbi:hypothetical protein SPRG_05767 [Saprolegnia parasitica CBS 223.65]|uniref:C2H2-type domain-containing protein n=1 Tax=Saprolegnia parasitica (strain CBS 223.65) TaxID=695850 RepID=A0A067CQT6_SAPPC|nr:hypothetical protein SPRG_05767 [Saprolegnia parasitica CBS 223.65]KDO28896.1 hypothetical protein SPRG_05767 [Saprolegnia parasitica CBS 223.65]|eukprot:XP_012200440.1 hypothetical protein SPRG_05767 [Saprolegnia parasitica CBS 223.65]
MVAAATSGLVVPIQRGRNGTLECPQHRCTFETDEVASLAVHMEARHELGIAIGAPSTIDGEHVREARVQHMLSAHDGRHLLHASDAMSPHRNLASTHVTSLTQLPSPETDGAIMPTVQIANSPTHRQSMEPTPAMPLHPDEPTPGRVPTTSSPRRVAVAFRATQLTAMAFKLTSSVVLGPVAATAEATSIAPMTPPSPRPHVVSAASSDELSAAERSNTLRVRHENEEAAMTSSAATSSDAPGHEPNSIPAASCTPPVAASSEHDVLTAVSSPSKMQGAPSHVLSELVVASQGADLGGDDNLDSHDGDDGLDVEEKPRLAGLDAVPSVLDTSSEHDVLAFTPPEEEAVQLQTLDESVLKLSSPPSPGADPDDGVDYLDDDVDDHDEPCVTASIVQGSATDAPPEAMMTSGTSQTLAHKAVGEAIPLSPLAKDGDCPDSPRTPVRASAPFTSLAYRPETPETPSLPPTPDVAPTPSPFHNLRHSVRPTPPRRRSYHSDDDDDDDEPLRGRGPARRSLAGLSSSESSASPPRQRPLEPFECPEATCNYEHVDFGIFQFHCFREHGLHIREESDDEEDVVLEQPPPPPPMPQQRSLKTTKAPVKPRATTPVTTRLPRKVKAPSPPSSPDVVLVRPVIALHKNAAGEYSCPTPTCPYKKTTSISNLKSHCKAKHAYDVKKADDAPSLPKRGRKRPFVNATLLDSDGPSSTKYIRFLEALEPGQEVYFDVT